MYGATVTMVCEYKVGESEYVDSIKWYKDNREFYRIVPHTSIEKDKVVTFNRSGINLDLQRSGVSTTTTLGWFKNPVSCQTDRLMAGTKFSDYLGLKHYKKAKKIKHFIHLRLA